MNCVESRRRGRLLGLKVARLGLGGRMEGGGGGRWQRKLPGVYNSETYYDNKIKIGGTVENHQLINLV